MTKVTKKGEIAEVAETYSFLNTAYPCLNEKQLAIVRQQYMEEKNL